MFARSELEDLGMEGEVDVPLLVVLEAQRAHIAHHGGGAAHHHAHLLLPVLLCAGCVRVCACV